MSCLSLLSVYNQTTCLKVKTIYYCRYLYKFVYLYKYFSFSFSLSPYLETRIENRECAIATKDKTKRNGRKQMLFVVIITLILAFESE